MGKKEHALENLRDATPVYYHRLTLNPKNSGLCLKTSRQPTMSRHGDGVRRSRGRGKLLMTGNFGPDPGRQAAARVTSIRNKEREGEREGERCK